MLITRVVFWLDELVLIHSLSHVTISWWRSQWTLPPISADIRGKVTSPSLRHIKSLWSINLQLNLHVFNDAAQRTYINTYTCQRQNSQVLPRVDLSLGSNNTDVTSYG